MLSGVGLEAMVECLPFHHIGQPVQITMHRRSVRLDTE
jgi:hypothetical protein